MRTLFLLVFVLSLSTLTFSQSSNQKTQDSLAVSATITAFVDAFSNLKWEPFLAHFSEEATAFFPPSARIPTRANNKTEIAAIFKKVFENAQKQNPPHINILPRELKIQMMDNAAIVTFHLDDPGMFGRRSLVLKKVNNDWLIVHLHASGVPKEN